MKLGIFGDSFATCSHDDVGYTWPKLLYMESEIEGQVDKNESFTTCFARPGTSAYWSYNNFINQRHRFDHIIFCTTYHNRWPLLPRDIETYGWNIHSHDVPGFPDELKQMNKFYYDIFDHNLLRLINRSIFREVNEICKKENKYLVNIICFDKDHYDQSLTDFPIFWNLHHVSENESIIINGENLTMREYVNERQNYDRRQCHMGHKNNLILKNILLDCLRNKRMDLRVDLFNTNYHWAGHDDSLYDIFRFPKTSLRVAAI